MPSPSSFAIANDEYTLCESGTGTGWFYKYPSSIELCVYTRSSQREGGKRVGRGRGKGRGSEKERGRDGEGEKEGGRKREKEKERREQNVVDML